MDCGPTGQAIQAREVVKVCHSDKTKCLENLMTASDILSDHRTSTSKIEQVLTSCQDRVHDVTAGVEECRNLRHEASAVADALVGNIQACEASASASEAAATAAIETCDTHSATTKERVISCGHREEYARSEAVFLQGELTSLREKAVNIKEEIDAVEDTVDAHIADTDVTEQEIHASR